MLRLSGGYCSKDEGPYRKRNHPDPWEVGDEVEGAIRTAAEKYDVPFGFMLGLCACESSFSPGAMNTLGTEEKSYGLFQFNRQGGWSRYSVEWLLDPYNNADLAASTLSKEYDIKGDWVKAAEVNWYLNAGAAMDHWIKWTQDGSLVNGGGNGNGGGGNGGGNGNGGDGPNHGDPPIIDNKPPSVITSNSPVTPFLIILGILGIAVVAAVIGGNDAD